MTPYKVYAESDSLWHEMGNVSRGMSGGTFDTKYYTRWFKNDST
eukprot:UN00034